MNVKMTLTFPNETIGELKKKAEAEGFLRPQSLARYLIVRALKKGIGGEISDDGGRREYRLALENPAEIEAYVKAKRFGSVPDFAAFAMEQAMTRHPLSEAQKARLVKRDGDE